MPNQQSVSRELLHTREIICQGYLRSDGMLDIEGRIRDVSALACDLPFHHVAAGQPVHDMRLLMTLDRQLVIHAIAAVTDAGPTPVCADIAPAYARLVGLQIGPGFKQQVKAQVGGVEGCTHVTELVERMASAAMQVRFTLGRVEQLRSSEGIKPLAKRNSWVVDTCHAYRRDGEVVRLLDLKPDN
jgi:hypothetical protein